MYDIIFHCGLIPVGFEIYGVTYLKLDSLSFEFTKIFLILKLSIETSLGAFISLHFSFSFLPLKITITLCVLHSNRIARWITFSTLWGSM